MTLIVFGMVTVALLFVIHLLDKDIKRLEESFEMLKLEFKTHKALQKHTDTQLKKLETRTEYLDLQVQLMSEDLIKKTKKAKK